MPSARARRRGAFLNCRLAVNGIQKAACSRPAAKSKRLFMPQTLHRSGRKVHAAAQKPKDAGDRIPRRGIARRRDSQCRLYDLLSAVTDDSLPLLAQALDTKGHQVARL